MAAPIKDFIIPAICLNGLDKMLKNGDITRINIDSLAYGGEGVGKIDGLTVFVPDSVSGDELEIELISVKKSFAKGKIVKIINPSTHRIKPFCALFNVCGGCQWQHISYDEQIRAKKKIVEDNIKKIAHLDVPVNDVLPGDYNAEFRCKVQYPVQQTKVSRRFLAGYYKKASHELVNIKYCPIQPDIINKITQFVREKAIELSLTAYNEKHRKGLIRHLVYRYSQTQKKLIVIVVINAEKITPEVVELCRAIRLEFPEVAGTLINFNKTNTNLILGRKTELITGKDFVEETLAGRKFKISANSFFQVNPSAAVKMFDTVYDIIKNKGGKPSILDVYSGVGSFSIWIKSLASAITAIEENPHAVKDALENIKLNSDIEGANIETIEGNADEILQKFIESNIKFDVTILDPPRKGCSEEALNSVVSLTDKYIIYVSCNPSTLARDMKFLFEKGFIPEFIQPVDMFCHTYHIESIAVLTKK